MSAIVNQLKVGAAWAVVHGLADRLDAAVVEVERARQALQRAVEHAAKVERGLAMAERRAGEHVLQ